jgi:hypothetical protein
MLHIKPKMQPSNTNVDEAQNKHGMKYGLSLQ